MPQQHARQGHTMELWRLISTALFIPSFWAHASSVMKAWRPLPSNQTSWSRSILRHHWVPAGAYPEPCHIWPEISSKGLP